MRRGGSAHSTWRAFMEEDFMATIIILRQLDYMESNLRSASLLQGSSKKEQ